MAHLTLDGVVKRFGRDRPAVDGVTLSVEPGTFLALLGPSGCGKTTTLRLIAGFEAPDSGRIVLGERLLADRRAALPPEERNMAMVFQSHALWPHMSVAENVGYPLKVRGINGAAYERKVGHALETVALAALRDRRPAELSGGQKQRVALARCLVTSPRVILFDEPLASLDRHLKASLETAFRDFHRETGATIIYVTHDQAEAMALADRVAVMIDGRIAQLDTPQAVYRRPETAEVAALIGNGAIIDAPAPVDAGREISGPALLPSLADRAGVETCRVLVRPEDVVDDPDGLEFTVRDCVFRGERYCLDLVDAAERRLLAYAAEPCPRDTVVRRTIRRAWRLSD